MILEKLPLIACFWLLLAETLAVKPPGYVEPPKIQNKNPPKFAYNYEIASDDKATGTQSISGHQQVRDGINTTGNFFVQTKDATQDVSYFSDDWGFHPVVKYSTKGEKSHVTSHFALGKEAVDALHLTEDGKFPVPAGPSSDPKSNYRASPTYAPLLPTRLPQDVGLDIGKKTINQASYQIFPEVLQEVQVTATPQYSTASPDIVGVIAKSPQFVTNSDVLNINALRAGPSSTPRTREDVKSRQEQDPGYGRTFQHPIVVGDIPVSSTTSREYLPPDPREQIDHNQGQFLKEVSQFTDTVHQSLETDQHIADATPSPRKEAPSRQFLRKFKSRGPVKDQTHVPSTTQAYVRQETLVITQRPISNKFLAPVQAGRVLANDDCNDEAEHAKHTKTVVEVQKSVNIKNELINPGYGLRHRQRNRCEDEKCKEKLVVVQQVPFIIDRVVEKKVESPPRVVEKVQYVESPPQIIHVESPPKIVQVEGPQKIVEKVKFVDRPVEKIVEKYVDRPVAVPGPPKIVETVKYIDRPYPVDRIVEKIVDRPVHVDRYVEKKVELPPKVVEKVVHIPVDRVVEKVVHVESPPKIIDRPVHIEGPPKVVQKVVHVPVDRVVEKVVHVETPPKIVHVDRPVEKIVHVPGPSKIVHIDRPVEKLVQVDRPVEKVVHVDRPYPVEKIVHVESPPKIVHVDRPVEKIVHVASPPKVVHIDRPVEKIVQVDRPVEKIIHVDRPFPVEKVVHVDRPYPVEKVVHVDRPVEKIVHVDRPVPFEKVVHVESPPKIVEKVVHVDRPFPVEKVVHVDRPVEKIVHVDRPVEKIVHVDRPYPVEKIIHVDRPVPVEKIVHVQSPPKIVEKVVHVDRPYPIEKVVHVDRPVEKIVHVDRPVEKIVHVDRPYPVEKVVHVDRPVPFETIKFVERIVEKPVHVKVPVKVFVPVHHEKQVHLKPLIKTKVKTDSHFSLKSLFGGLAHGGEREVKHIFFNGPVHSHLPYHAAPPPLPIKVENYHAHAIPEKPKFDGYHYEKPALNLQHLFSEKPSTFYGPPSFSLQDKTVFQSQNSHFNPVGPVSLGPTPLGPAPCVHDQHGPSLIKDDYIGPTPLISDIWATGTHDGITVKRHIENGRSLRIESGGFLPPLEPSLPIDEHGNPLKGVESGSKK